MRFAVLVLLVGCGGGDPSCKDAVGKAVAALGQKAGHDSAAMIGHCEQENWPGELRRCIAEVRDQRDMLACMLKHGPRETSGERGSSRSSLAKLAVDEYANKDFGLWASAHPDKTCPDNLLEVLQHIGKTRDDLNDPWGTPYKMLCGANVPAGVSRSGIAVYSFGPDMTENTTDDIKSWERLSRSAE